MPQSEENLGDRTTIFRREDTVPVSVQEEFGHYLVVIGGAGPGAPGRRGGGAPPIGGLEAAPLIIGREGQCGLVLANADVSRRHCRAELKGGEVIATDLNSTNGTYLAGKRIREPT